MVCEAWQSYVPLPQGALNKKNFLVQKPATLLVSSFDTEVITIGEMRICHWIIGFGFRYTFVFFFSAHGNSKSDFPLPSHPFPATATETSGLHNYNVPQ